MTIHKAAAKNWAYKRLKKDLANITSIGRRSLPISHVRLQGKVVHLELGNRVPGRCKGACKMKPKWGEPPAGRHRPGDCEDGISGRQRWDKSELWYGEGRQ